MSKNLAHSTVFSNNKIHLFQRNLNIFNLSILAANGSRIQFKIAILNWLRLTHKALHGQSLAGDSRRPWSPLDRAWRSVGSTNNQNNYSRTAGLLYRSSSCLEFTAASPSLPVHQSQSVSSRAQDSSFKAGLSLTFPLRIIKETDLHVPILHTGSTKAQVKPNRRR